MLAINLSLFIEASAFNNFICALITSKAGSLPSVSRSSYLLLIALSYSIDGSSINCKAVKLAEESVSNSVYKGLDWNSALA